MYYMGTLPRTLKILASGFRVLNLGFGVYGAQLRV